jgi:hypothetical protein
MRTRTANIHVRGRTAGTRVRTRTAGTRVRTRTANRMRTRTANIRMGGRTIACLLAACCCAALAGCTVAQADRPDTTVKTPSVGRPPAPDSAQAALSSEAFTPYAALGLSSNDGLAPGESDYTLTGPCMTAAGYPGVTDSDFIVRFAVPDDPLAYTYPWGGWGYLGAADAQQYGFQYSTNAAVTALGIAPPPANLANPASLPAAEKAAAGKCSTIIQDFTNATGNGPLAGIGTLGLDIQSDMGRDRALNAATRTWSACMAKNGYSSLGSPQNVYTQEQQAMYGNVHGVVSGTISPAANQAQITVAVTDARCTQSSDLAGIYFAVQASYEQQLVSANRQALTAAVSEYRTAYTKELKRLPALLRTTKARPFPGLGKNHRGGTTGGA